MGVKINISISEKVLEKLDEAAREANTSRSAFLSEAVTHYLEEKQAKKEQERRRRASEEIDRFREEFGIRDGATEVIKWRDKH